MVTCTSDLLNWFQLYLCIHAVKQLAKWRNSTTFNKNSDLKSGENDDKMRLFRATWLVVSWGRSTASIRFGLPSCSAFPLPPTLNSLGVRSDKYIYSINLFRGWHVVQFPWLLLPFFSHKVDSTNDVLRKIHQLSHKYAINNDSVARFFLFYDERTKAQHN